MKAKTTRRILALVLSVVMVLALIPAAFAADFPDVPSGSWFKQYVDYCVDFGLMGDTGNGTFNPNGTVTREQAVQTLYAMAGKPAVEYRPDFSDVKDNQWYTDAIMWAVENGITSGTGNGKFGVGVNVTREQIATFFYKYSIYAGMEEDFASINSFPDAGKVSSWAKMAMQWAVKYGVISGKAVGNEKYLKPQDPLTRAELAAMLSSFHKIVPTPCEHEIALTGAKAATCTEDGYTGDMVCSKCGFVQSKGEVIPALGHEYGDDGFCIRCGEPNPEMQRVFSLADELPVGKQVIIYNPGHQMVIKNENDNDWYLIPESLQPTDGKFIEENEGDLDPYIWTVVDNGDGSVTFVNGENAIAAWVSGTYIELTNNANYPDSDKSWVVTSAGENNLFFIGSKTLSNSYGPAYIECYYNANKDQTKISGYTSSNPASHMNDYGFQFYSFGKPCQHNWEKTSEKAATCTEAGSIIYTCSICRQTKAESIPALGHIDADNNGTCDRCGAPIDVFTAIKSLDEITDGTQVVFYNPGHGMAIVNETDNNWYLVPQPITPDGDTVKEPDDSIIWTIVDNGDGTFSFVNGDNAIAAWVSGTYIELTNDANYDGADTKWKLIDAGDGMFYIQSATISNSYGPAYIECYYNANKDKTNISGYTSSDPSSHAADYGFMIFAAGGCTHNWVAGTPVAPTCTEDGYTPYTCSICNAAKKGDIVPATGHIDADSNNICDVCGAELGGTYVRMTEIKDGDEVVIYNPGHGMAISNENDNNWYLVPVAVTPADDKIVDPDAAIVWTVVDNKDGTFSFKNGDNAIVAWLSVTDKGTYIELTNDANYDGADGKWIVSFTNDLGYIQSSSLSNSYGPAYIECYYNANKDKTNISGYTSSDPTAKPNDFGFEFYVKGGTVCAHNWEKTSEKEATCTAAGEITYKCSLCGKTKTETIAALGHDFGGDNVCDRCGYIKTEGGFTLTDTLSDGAEVIIVNPGSKNAVKAAVKASYYVDLQAVEIVNDTIETEDASIIWTVSDNGDGTYSFTSGSNTLCVGVNGTHTNLLVNAADGTYNGWTLIPATSDNTYFVKSTIPAGSNGDFYLEYNASYSEFTIYGSTAPDEAKFGIQFYAKGGPVCDHNWEKTGEVAATCLAAGSITYSCSECGKTKTETIAALGHDFGDDNECDRCGYIKPDGEGFVKVTDTADLTDGTYLIVYETDSIAMNGGLTKVDAGHNTIDVVINDYVIEANDTTMAASFEIKAMSGGWSIQAAGGSFISGSASANTIKEGASAVANTITIDADGNAVIFAGGYLMFNKTAGDTQYRFRYYKTQTQQPIQLYKLAD